MSWTPCSGCARAYDRNKLVTTKEQVVSVRRSSRQIIAIEPAVPDTLYVPTTAGGLRRLAIRRLSGIPLLLGLSHTSPPA
jgi:hypothetical protein